jgi:hypothetical protein
MRRERRMVLRARAHLLHAKAEVCEAKAERIHWETMAMAKDHAAKTKAGGEP